MRRLLAALAGAVLVASAAATASASPAQHRSAVAGRSAAAAEEQERRFLCNEGDPLCAEVADAIGYEGRYTGHDEPSLLFYSNRPGSGNDSSYRLVVPQDPPTLPTQDGTGGTFNFQDRIAFWIGMDLCDNQSAPEFTHAPCTPNSDSNIFDGADPTKPDYIGFHPGTAFLELQFYPPGWVSFENGISCDATKWCAAMAIFSFNSNQNTGVANNADCLGKVGIEPANFAFITRNGTPQAPPAPLDLTLASFTPDPGKDLFMNAGDRLDISIHDSPAGLVTSISDLTTGQSGSMTASVGNGFAQVNYDPTATTCTQTPYAFHPMYSTSSEHTRVPWAAHSYNVAFSDEIGHFEYCSAVNADGTCSEGVSDPGGADSDDTLCRGPDESLRIQIGGCFGTDTDFDGVSYQHTWPGSLANPGEDRMLNPRSILLSSPLTGGQNYQRVAFEADLPRIEAADFGGNCNRSTGANCVNPPPGANFYPIYSTRGSDAVGCFWQLGGTHIPGTRNTFGGTSTAEYGPLLFLDYPGPGFTPIHRTNDFRRVLSNNPCQRS
ncbi:MAG TPA: hypothetical protein VFD04_18340 [Actinomycetes bacterium]|nr:hypothetical protein [Actinomycetes bacterium]